MENRGDVVRWEADVQIALTSTVMMRGSEASALDLNGHKAAIAKLLMRKPRVYAWGRAAHSESSDSL